MVAEALDLMDEVGLDGLTMRRLAERLGVTAASLYRHVRDRDDLVALLADEVSGLVPMVASDAPWRQALRDMARGYRAVLLAHRDAARLLAGTPPAGPQRLRHIEALLQVLVAAGFADRDAAWAAYHFNNFVTESVADEVRIASTARIEGMTSADLNRRARDALRALPAERFPCLTRMADSIASDDPAALFEFGLELWLRALDSLVRRG